MTLSAARNAIFFVFLGHGFLIGSWAPHIALAKDRLDVGTAAFGVALLSLPLGSVVAMPIAGILSGRYGGAQLTLITGLLFALTALGPPHAPDFISFVIAGVFMGAAIGSMDVSMNVQGLDTERAMRRPILSVLHGGFSLGCIMGAAASYGLIRQFGPSWQIVLSCAMAAVSFLWASRYFKLVGPHVPSTGTGFAMPTKATLFLGCLCFLALMGEGSVLDWGAIFLKERLGIDAATGAMAFAAYQGGMAVSRFGGDWLRMKFGAVSLVATSAIASAAGIFGAVLFPQISLAIACFALAGLGMGNIAPVLFAGGGRLEPDSPGHGIAAVTSLGYMGFLAGPPIIGLVAQYSSLAFGLALTGVACLVIAAFAKTVKAADTY